MFEFNNLVTAYEPALALVFVLAYFVVVALILRLPGPQRTSVPQCELPPGASPGISAWLFERGKLPWAMAAVLVDMAAKGYLKIEQSEDLCTVTQVLAEMRGPLQPEEDALARTLFEGYDCFSFDEVTPQLAKALTGRRNQPGEPFRAPTRSIPAKRRLCSRLSSRPRLGRAVRYFDRRIDRVRRDFAGSLTWLLQGTELDGNRCTSSPTRIVGPGPFGRAQGKQ